MKNPIFFTGLIVMVLVAVLNTTYISSGPVESDKRSVSSLVEPLSLFTDTAPDRLTSIPKLAGVRLSDHIMAKEVVVALLDTGIDLNNRWIMDRVYKINGKPQIYDVSGETKDGSDTHGHGTLMATIILSINPSARIASFKVTSGKDNASHGYVEGLEGAKLLPGVKIINISGGGTDYIPAEDTLIQEAQEAGILVIAAAGNFGKNLSTQSFYPAGLINRDNLISVANLKADGELYRKSNFGEDFIDIGIIGTQIPGYDHEGSLVSGTGSSQATAMVSGIASLMIGISPEMKPENVKTALTETASFMTRLKHGRVNAQKAIAKANEFNNEKFRILKSKHVSLNEERLLK